MQTNLSTQDNDFQESLVKIWMEWAHGKSVKDYVKVAHFIYYKSARNCGFSSMT